MLVDTRWRARLAGILAGCALAAGAGGATPAPALAGGDQAAVAVNTKDDSSLFRFAFSVRRVMGDVVDQTNAAVAYASCEQCQTVAISIQVLLVMGDASVVTPTNLAVALNESCTLCDTLASAYQFVFGTGDRLRFTAEGNRRIAEIRRAFKELRRGDLTIDAVQARADELTNQLRDVLRTELTTAGRPPADEPVPAPDEAPTTTEESPPPATESPGTEPDETAPAPPPPQDTEAQPEPQPGESGGVETTP